MAYPIVRTDLMSGTTDRSQLRSVIYYNQDSAAEVHNDRETFKGVDPAKGDSIESLVLIASPEIMYDATKTNLDEFVNPAGERSRGYRLHKGDIFSVTVDGFTVAEDVTVAVGYVVEIAAAGGTKPAVVATATSGSTTIGKIVAIDTVGSKTYYVVCVG